MTRRTPVIAALAAGLALRLYFIWATPIGDPFVPNQLSSYNDEIAHANYVQHVVRTGTLPPHVASIQGDNALVEGYFENYQPPLYYVVAAAIARVLALDSMTALTLLGRLLNLLLFAALIPALLMVVAQLQLRALHRDAALIFLALNGIAVRFSATATNDILFWLFAGAMIWVVLRMRGGEKTAYNLLFFGALAIAGLYTKLTTLLLLPLPLLALWRIRRPSIILSLAGVYAFIAAMTVPIWLRNVGDFGAWIPLSAGFGAPNYGIPPWESFVYAVRSFVFPWSELWHGWIGLLVMLPAIVLMAMSVLTRSTWLPFRTHPVLPITLAITMLAFVWLNIQYHQAEARYLFAAWPVIVLIVSRPVHENKTALWLFVAALLLPYALLLLPSLGI